MFFFFQNGAVAGSEREIWVPYRPALIDLESSLDISSSYNYQTHWGPVTYFTIVSLMKTKLFVLKIPFVTWRESELIICQLQGAELFFLGAENKHTRNQLLWNKCEYRLVFKLLPGKNLYIDNLWHKLSRLNETVELVQLSICMCLHCIWTNYLKYKSTNR